MHTNIEEESENDQQLLDQEGIAVSYRHEISSVEPIHITLEVLFLVRVVVVPGGALGYFIHHFPSLRLSASQSP